MVVGDRVRFLHMADLVVACRQGDVAEVSRLIAAGANVDKPGVFYTPLYTACIGQKLEVVKLLLAAGADVNLRSGLDEGTVLHQASARGAEEIVKILLAVPDIDVTQSDKLGWTALHWASHRGHRSTVQILLSDPRVDVNAVTNLGDTSLSVAALNGNPLVVRLLLAVPGVDISRANNDGKSALAIATENPREGRPEVVKLIKEALKRKSQRWAVLLGRQYIQARDELVYCTAPGQAELARTNWGAFLGIVPEHLVRIVISFV